jgi:epoxyqueuosine reductase
LRYTEGGPIRRIGYQRWRRNLAVAMGNALRSAEVDHRELLSQGLHQALDGASELLREHIDWALNTQNDAAASLR